ncbi:MAG: hypothetical protein Q7U77_11060 [Sediminibacterium sp.]|nr:hypothetical protein [Sediminibacterium sp.]
MQLIQYTQRAGLASLYEDELTMKAKEKDLYDDQIQKLKSRMQTINPAGGEHQSRKLKLQSTLR